MGKGASGIRRALLGRLMPRSKSRAEKVYEREFVPSGLGAGLSNGMLGATHRALEDIRGGFDLGVRVGRDHIPVFHTLAAEALFAALIQENTLSVRAEDDLTRGEIGALLGRDVDEPLLAELMQVGTTRLRDLLAALIAVDGIDRRLLPEGDRPSYLRPLIGCIRAVIDLADERTWSTAAEDTTAITDFFAAPAITPLLRTRYWRRCVWESATVCSDAAPVLEAPGSREDRAERADACLLNELMDIVSERHLSARGANVPPDAPGHTATGGADAAA